MADLNNKLSKNEVVKIVEKLHLNKFFTHEFIYEIYEIVLITFDDIKNSFSLLFTKSINHYEIIYYIVGECLFALPKYKNENIDINDELKNQIASIVADKYLSLSILNHQEIKLTNKFLPTVSSLNVYLNFMLNILNSYHKNDPKSSLVADLLLKSVSISRCILNLLVHGYETEAFGTWRTLHECECTLILLDKYGDEIIDSYLKHMNFGLAFNNSIPNKETQNQIFQSMKNEMKELDLKSKDIKKYIEYGWLYSVAKKENISDFKLNFRDGLQLFAGLSSYNERYELSSEIIHSTPLLIYNRKQFFYYLTLLSLYESFFRLEKVFLSLFTNLFNDEQKQKYLDMRKLYYSQLTEIYKTESFAFSKTQKPDLKN